MISKPKNLIAFSLTEVLITMFILMLIVIASGPVVTKKVIKKPKPHGVWECRLVNGVHVATISFDGGTPSGAGSSEEYCLFEPQPSAENYTVTVVGGGGGGASGATAVQDVASYGQSIGHYVEEKGFYDVLVVGGGGGGSAKYKDLGNLGGSAGGVDARENVELKQGYYILDAGLGGKAGGTMLDESDSDVVEDKCVELPNTNSPDWKDICDGGDGQPSKLYKVGGGTNIEVRGGYGGKKDIDTSRADNDLDGCLCRAANGYQGGYLFNGCTNTMPLQSCKKARDILGNSTQMFGHGGDGTATDVAHPGFTGIVLLRSATFYAGGGGHQGSVAYMNIKKFKNKEPIKVTVGRGGAGATVENTNGEQGENSSFGNFITAKGGQGGEIKAKSASDKENGLSGESGYESPYGGQLSGGSASCDALNGTNDMDTDDGYVNAGSTTYGAGGGGGGAFSHKSECGKWGKGGRGMPGYVRVEWN